MSITPEQKLWLLYDQLEALDHLLHAILSLREPPKEGEVMPLDASDR